MTIIPINPSPSDAYQGPRLCDGALPANHAIIPYTLDMSVFYAYNGFVVPDISNNEWTSYTPNIEAWEAWKASLLEPETDLQTDVGHAGRPQILTHTNGTGGKHRCFIEFLNGSLNWVRLTGYKISWMPFSLWIKSQWKNTTSCGK